MVHPPSSPTPGARSGSCWRCYEVRSRSWWPPGGRTSRRCRSSEWRYLFLVGGQAGARQGPSGALGPGAAASRFRGLAGRCSSGETRAATVQEPTVMTWGFLTSRRVGTTTRGSVLGLSGESFNGP